MKDLFHDVNPIPEEKWLEQVTKDLKGADFNEKLVNTIDQITIQPLYTRKSLPQFIVDPDAEFMQDLDPEFVEAIADQGQQSLTWNITEDVLVTENDNLNNLIAAARARGASHVRISVTSDDVWDHVVNEIIKLTTPANFIFNVYGDLSEGDVVNKWRDRVGHLGERDRLLFGIEFDPIGYWQQYGNDTYNGTMFAHLADLFFRLSGHLHDCKLIKIDTTHFANQGEDVVSQLVKTLQITSTYFDEMEKRNVPLEELVQLCTFRFGIGSNFFFEIAKLRAFKILWHNLIKAYLPEMDFITNPEIHCVTSTASFTQTDEHSNLLRTTTAAMSAILGGCDVLIVTPFTNSGDNNATQLATNIQNILRYESYIDRYRDAANGSFYIERLTQQFGQQAWQQFIDSK